MNYPQALQYTHSLKRLGSTPGLACMVRVMEILGNPQDSLSCIHIAGTNGKGSVCAMTAAALEAAGYKVGLFTSPYLVDFRERFQVGGRMIAKDTYAALVGQVKAAVEQTGEELSQFAFITAVAFCWFAREQCDVVVLETGLGGRLDATNIIKKPLVTAITSLSLDHTELLGNTIREIAREKCGIMKPTTPTVLSMGQPVEAISVAMETAAGLGGRVILPNPTALQVLETTPGATRFVYGGEEYTLSLAGAYQPENAVTAIEILRSAAGLALPEEAIKKGLSVAVHPGRCQVLRAHPLILLDGAHNPGGAAALSHTLSQFLKGEKSVGVCGVMSDKAARELAEQMGPCLEELIAVTPHTPRALPAEELATVFAPYCKTTTALADEALLKRLWLQEKPVVVFGSLYLAGELLQILNSGKGADFDETKGNSDFH